MPNESKTTTPRTDAVEVSCMRLAHAPKEDLADAVAKIARLLLDHARQLEHELSEANKKSEFLESKGLTVGYMKTSDRPEPYLVYVAEPDSEFDDTIHVNKLINAEIERDNLKAELDEVHTIQTFALNKDYYEKFEKIRAENEQLRKFCNAWLNGGSDSELHSLWHKEIKPALPHVIESKEKEQ